MLVGALSGASETRSRAADDAALEADRDVLDRHRLAQDRVVDLPRTISPECEALGHQGPLRLVDGLADEVLVDQGRPVVRPHLAEDDQLGISRGSAARPSSAAGRPSSRRRHGHQQEQVGEGEVGQDAPACRAAAGGARAPRARGRCG